MQRTKTAGPCRTHVLSEITGALAGGNSDVHWLISGFSCRLLILQIQLYGQTLLRLIDTISKFYGSAMHTKIKNRQRMSCVSLLG